MSVSENSQDCDDDDFASRCRRRRARRAQRRRNIHRGTQLNIVSLIDVFAVLVFFLLSGASITAGRYQQLPLSMPTTAQSESGVAESEALMLTVTLLPSVIVVADHNGELGRVSRGGEPDASGRSLSDVLAEVKVAHPQERQATLRVASGIEYADIVKVMDTLSHDPGQGVPLFPDISLGDALIAEVRQ